MQHRWWLVGAAVVLVFGFGGSTALAQDAGNRALGAGPLQASRQGNPLLEASCDVYVGGTSSRSFTVAIMASPAPLGGASVPIAQQFFPNVPPGQTRTLMAAAPLVTNGAPLFCIVQCGGVQPLNLFSTLSILELFDDSIETVAGALGNTSLSNFD